MKSLITTLTAAALILGSAALTASAQQRDQKRDGTGIDCQYPDCPRVDCPYAGDCPRAQDGDRQRKRDGTGPNNGGKGPKAGNQKRAGK